MPYSIDELRRRIAPIAGQYGVKRVSLFGSYSRGCATADSDVDLLIEKGRSLTLFELSAMRLSMQDALALPVDIVTTAGSDREFLQAIKEDEVLLYAIA